MGNAFDHYYKDYFKDRWEKLKKALLMPSATFDFATSNNKTYYMDAASVFAASLFSTAVLSQNNEQDHCSILDACAAPGGKTLVTTEILAESGLNFSILANELSSERRRRLSGVLDEHLSPENRKHVTVSGFDTAKAGARKTEHERFDAILLDAPCSSERHVLADDHALIQWTPNRVKNLAMRQWSLLSSCMLLAKHDALIAYVTCALTSFENDAVVGRISKKFGGEARILDPEPYIETLRQSQGDNSKVCIRDKSNALPRFERTENGIAVLPDTSEGAGPIYIALIKKL